MTAISDTSDIRHQTSDILHVTNLHKRYRMGGESLHVLRGVDLDVREGEWLAILGASGSGKSTLLHLIGGLDHPDEGAVSYRGLDVFKAGASRVDRYRNRDVGFVFQFYHLLPELSALENVMVSAMIGSGVASWPSRRAAVRQRATQLLEGVGLGERMRHRPAKLSGGERQRVAIARALMNEPALLLADEPTGNLDADTGGQILNVLRDIHARGQTVIMVTHDERIAAAADRQVRLDRGQLATQSA
jgi:lipoprotein-releasing system ATP-binding protein